jgi:hypothetical protein
MGFKKGAEVTQVVTFHSGFQIPYFTYTLFPEKNVFE